MCRVCVDISDDVLQRVDCMAQTRQAQQAGIMWLAANGVPENGDVTMGMAEREGFEPSEPARVHLISNQARSATPPPLLKFSRDPVRRLETITSTS
jgi:hypothetical protein